MIIFYHRRILNCQDREPRRMSVCNIGKQVIITKMRFKFSIIFLGNSTNRIPQLPDEFVRNAPRQQSSTSSSNYNRHQDNECNDASKSLEVVEMISMKIDEPKCEEDKLLTEGIAQLFCMDFIDILFVFSNSRRRKCSHKRSEYRKIDRQKRTVDCFDDGGWRSTNCWREKRAMRWWQNGWAS